VRLSYISFSLRRITSYECDPGWPLVFVFSNLSNQEQSQPLFSNCLVDVYFFTIYVSFLPDCLHQPTGLHQVSKALVQGPYSDLEKVPDRRIVRHATGKADRKKEGAVKLAGEELAE